MDRCVLEQINTVNKQRDGQRMEGSSSGHRGGSSDVKKTSLWTTWLIKDYLIFLTLVEDLTVSCVVHGRN